MTAETACALCCALSCSISAACAVWALASASKARRARVAAELLLEAARRPRCPVPRPMPRPGPRPAPEEAPPPKLYTAPPEDGDGEPDILPFPRR